LRRRWSLLHMHGRCDAGRTVAPADGEYEVSWNARVEPSLRASTSISLFRQPSPQRGKQR
jgi:tellurite resistance protein